MDIIMKKLFFLISFLLIFIIGLTGCSSKKESSELLEKYYSNLKSNNIDENYDYLSSASKNIWTKESYTEWESLNEEEFTFKNVKIEKKNEYKDKELDGVKYKNIVEYNITEFNHDNYKDKDINLNYVMYSVNENQQWKIYRGEEDSREIISKSKCLLASMYFHGKGKNKDLKKSESILNESIEENPDYSPNYLLLGFVYNELERYDSAICIVQEYLERAKDNEEKSMGYDILGLTYQGKEDYDKSKACYTEAIEANPSDEVAKTALTKLNSKSE